MKRPPISQVINDAVLDYRKRLVNLPDEDMRRRLGEMLDGIAPMTEECQQAWDELLEIMQATHEESQRKLKEHEVHAKEVSAKADAELQKGAVLRDRLGKIAESARTFSGSTLEAELLGRLSAPLLDERPTKVDSLANDEEEADAAEIADWVTDSESALVGSFK